MAGWAGTSDSWSLARRVILVTGATDGLGRALCAELVDLGADVLVHGRSDERIRETVEGLRRRAAPER